MLLSYRSLLLFLLLAAGTRVSAQQDDSLKKILDSLSVSATATDTVIATKQDEDVAEGEPLPDTTVTSIYRSIRADTLALIKRDKGFYYQSWLDSLLRAEAAAQKKQPDKKPMNLPDLNGFFMVFKLILWLMAASVLFFVIYKLSVGSNALFIKSRKNINITINTEEKVIDGRYEDLLKKAETENNYRLAVRYLHLQALYNLGEQGYIRFATEKTNYQYLNELRNKSASIADVFSGLTYQYEYIWYGEYSITNVAYYALKKRFNEFNSQTA